jgi:hypothetical protein
MGSIRAWAILAVVAVFSILARPVLAEDQSAADADYAKRMFAGGGGKLKNYACFVRIYDAQHLAQHPQQKVSVMKLLITAEKNIPDDKLLEYSFRLGANFRDRPGDFDSSGECGHAPTVRSPDTDAPVATGIDFECNVDCDGGGVTLNLASKDASVFVKLPDHIRIWKGKDPDEAAVAALMAGADDKIFRLDRADLKECAILANDRKELAAMRHK